MTMGWCVRCEKKATTLYKQWVHVVRDETHEVKKADAKQAAAIVKKLAKAKKAKT